MISTGHVMFAHVADRREPGVLLGVVDHLRADGRMEHRCASRAVYSSVIMLFTARSEQIAAEPVAEPAGERRGHVAAVAAAEHADPVAVAERVALEGGVEHGDDVVDVDRAPTRARVLLGLRAADRLAPRGVAAAAAARVAHQHHEPGLRLHLGLVEERLAILRERATVHVDQHRVRRRLVEVSVGRMIQASISPEPSVQGTANFSQPDHDRVSDVTGPSSVTSSGRVLDGGLGHRHDAAGGVEPLYRQRALRHRLRRPRPVGRDLVDVRLAAVLDRDEHRVVVGPHGLPGARVGLEVPVEVGRHPRDARHRRSR